MTIMTRPRNKRPRKSNSSEDSATTSAAGVVLAVNADGKNTNHDDETTRNSAGITSNKKAKVLSQVEYTQNQEVSSMKLEKSSLLDSSSTSSREQEEVDGTTAVDGHTSSSNSNNNSDNNNSDNADNETEQFHPATAAGPASWKGRYQQLLDYKTEFGHTRVPKGYMNKKLWCWVATQRYQYKKFLLGEEGTTMTEERVDLLNAIDFDWGANHVSWEERFQELVAFHNIFGHFNVPQRKDEEYKQLGLWVSRQRNEYKKLLAEVGLGQTRSKRKSHMTLERIQRLEAIGFQWEFTQGTKGGNTKTLSLDPSQVSSAVVAAVSQKKKGSNMKKTTSSSSSVNPKRKRAKNKDKQEAKGEKTLKTVHQEPKTRSSAAHRVNQGSLGAVQESSLPANAKGMTWSPGKPGYETSEKPLSKPMDLANMAAYGDEDDAGEPESDFEEEELFAPKQWTRSSLLRPIQFPT